MSEQSAALPEIGEARPADLADLVRLFEAYRAFYGRRPEPQAALEFVTARLRERSTRFFVARLAGAAAGFAHILPSFDTLGLRNAWMLEDLFVAPALRRNGVASGLLRHVEAFARGTGASRLSLTTAHTNLAAQRLYLAHGYRLDEEFRAYHRSLS